ncbi:septum site-determining protein MinC [Clostridium sp. 19966]|uniref:septum site-determining protein MinC n=1 Tax=Clostridium sp. 19966 TaxID=2768166 RepID=UPI0028DD4477|nr:septum site-determining protein MinC [Clostridium sp. 19966]MDT8715275.1 septum site-determining protein MinC [Clostridium sp. 19966]
MEDGILIKGNKEGLNAVINMDKFKDFDDMLGALVEKLSRGKRFYKGSSLKITAELKYINEKDSTRLKELLLNEFQIKECIFQEVEEKTGKAFSGVYEGKTKFLRKTIRSGQRIEYAGNIVIIGDVNPGAEVYALGNVIVLGQLRGHVSAGMGGSDKAIVAAFALQPEILQIDKLITRSPEDNEKPQYPEVAKIKDGSIVVEPYLLNKYL